MRKNVVTWMIVALLLGAFGLSAHEAASVTGSVSASEQEADEGYFAIGPDAMIMAKTGTPLHDWMRAHIGQRVRLVVDVDPGSE